MRRWKRLWPPNSISQRRSSSPAGAEFTSSPRSSDGVSPSGNSSASRLIGHGGNSKEKTTAPAASRRPVSDQVNRSRPLRSTSVCKLPSSSRPSVAGAGEGSSQRAPIMARLQGSNGNITAWLADCSISSVAWPRSVWSGASRAVYRAATVRAAASTGLPDPGTASGRQQPLELGRIHGQIFLRAPGPVLHAVGRGEDATETQIALGLFAGRPGAGIRRRSSRSRKQPENSQQ